MKSIRLMILSCLAVSFQLNASDMGMPDADLVKSL